MKKWIIVAVCFILIGSIALLCILATLGGNLSELATHKLTVNHHRLDNSITDIVIKTSTADITFIPSNDNYVRITEKERELHTVSIEDGVLTIEVNPQKEWYDYIEVSFRSPKIDICLPAGDYGQLTVNASTGGVTIPEGFNFGDTEIKLSTGFVNLEKVRAEALSVSVSTGKTTLTDVNCKSLYSTGSTGDVWLDSVIARENFDIRRSTGDICFVNCDAEDIWASTDTGDVKGSLLTSKRFVTSTDTGRISVPETTEGGLCEIRTDTGNIEIEITQ